MPDLGSITANAAASALSALNARQEVIANNIANSGTPNFTAARVQFEDALSDAVKSGDGTFKATTTSSLSPSSQNGNNVNVDSETVSYMDLASKHSFGAQYMTSKLTGVLDAVSTN